MTSWPFTQRGRGVELPRTNPDSGRMKDLNHEPPDFKSSALNHSVTPSHQNYHIHYPVLVVWCKTSFTFLCSKDFLRITDGSGKRFDYCGNETGRNLLVTGDQVEMIFRSDDENEQRGYYLVFTLVSPPSVSLPLVSHGKCDVKKLIKLIKFSKCISLLKYQ